MIKKRVLLALIGAIVSIGLFAGCSATTNKEAEATGKKQEKIVKEKTQEAKIYFINTGQSDSILIKGEKNVLIDGGNNTEGKEVVKFLKLKDVDKIDYMIATHNDADHIGGLDEILKAVKVENVFVSNGDADTKTYKDFINAMVEKDLKPSVPLLNKEISLGDNSYLQFYNVNGGKSKNDQSLVTLYVNGEDKILFMGDAEKETEKEILSELPDVDLLKIGHHGSKTSTTKELLAKVKPEIAVICVGKNNKYGLPSEDVMKRLENKKIKVYRTDENGNIEFTSTGKTITTKSSKGSYEPGVKK